MLKERGFYIVQDRFFDDFSGQNLMDNKAERRPHYFAFKDRGIGLYWMIPMSSRVKKYQAIIDRRMSAGKPCDMLHICILDNGLPDTFLIQDMFPVTEDYIAREYIFAGNPLMLTSDREANIILAKARRVLNMLHRGIKFVSTQPDVLFIERTLLQKD